MEKDFTVGIFYVEEYCPQNQRPFPLEQAIFNAWKSQNRTQDINRRYYRFSEFEPKKSHFLVYFRAFRYDGLGYSKLDSEEENYTALDPDDYFFHGTTLLYDLQHKFVLLESSGMRAGAIGSYFSRFVNEDRPTSYNLRPRIDRSAENRYHNFRHIRTLDFRVAADPVGPLDRDSGLGMITSFSRALGAEFLDVKVTVGKKRSAFLSFARAKTFVDHMLESIGKNHDVPKLIVSGKGETDSNLEAVDLVQHQEKRSVPLPIGDSTRQVLIADRWRALERIRRKFIAETGLQG